MSDGEYWHCWQTEQPRQSEQKPVTWCVKCGIAYGDKDLFPRACSVSDTAHKEREARKQK